MKKTLPTVRKIRSMAGWCKHLRRRGKKLANKGTRRAFKGVGREAVE